MKKHLLTSLLIALLTVSASAQDYNYVSAKNTIELTRTTFLERVANYVSTPEWKYVGDKPCIIDFYTTWCGPCKRLAPILEEIAGEYKDKIYIYKVDAEKEAELAKIFGIRSYPSLIFCPIQGTPSKIAGLQPKENLETYIKRILLPEERESLTN